MTDDADPFCLTELRVLDGPNPWFPRAAIKATIHPAAMLAADEHDLVTVAKALELAPPITAGAPNSELRVQFCSRLLAALLRAISRRSGVRTLGVRSRHVPATDEIVVVFPWRHVTRAEALARALARLTERVVDPGCDIHAELRAAGADVAATEEGDHPETPVPTMPTVGVTGTNGKTTVTRLVAHIAGAAGHRVAWNTSDGVYMEGELVEAGDLTGFVGARTVLGAAGVTFAALEVARGGILRRGIGCSHVDVSVVTNIQADHLGTGGVETLEQLAEVKASLVRITKPEGAVVVNADDPRSFAMRQLTEATPFAFSLDHDSPGLRVVLDESGAAVTVVDGWITVQRAKGSPLPIVPVVDVPMTIAGLSPQNVANALAATAACVAVGLDVDAVRNGLSSFRPDPTLNPGRMNLFDIGGRRVIVDYGHNEEGLRALLQVANGLVAETGQVRLMLAAVGDRTDDILVGMGEAAGRGAAHVVICERETALRDTPRERLFGLLREGLALTGHEHVPGEPTEIGAIAAVLEQAQPGDVCALMVHDDRPGAHRWLTDHGAREITPDEVREIVTKAAARTSGG